MKTARHIIVILFFSLFSSVIFSQVRLPKLISDGMVLQRGTDLRIWGWASPGEKVSVSFAGSSYSTSANDTGKWEIAMPPMKAGGPYEMTVNASNTVSVKDILIGDVWICSGQSNMGSLRGFSRDYQEEIAKSENNQIRHFSVPMGFSLDERAEDVRSGRWVSANPKDVVSFAAVGYFFGKELYDTYKVPIGLINSSVGGSSAEAWISKEAIKSSYPRYYDDVEKFRIPGYLARVNQQDNERIAKWNSQLRKDDEGYKNPGQNWFDPYLNVSEWETTAVPGHWQDTRIGNIHGVVWYRREFDIPSSMTGRQAVLQLGRIVDADSVYINGAYIGSVGSQWSQRNYRIPENLLKAGTNTIVVRIINFIGHGGFVPGKPYKIIAGNDTVNLEGVWKYRVGAVEEPLEDRLPNYKIPTGLFTGMIAPLLNYKIKGAIWYQGESNTSRAGEHYELFKLLIRDWRANWNTGDFPFLFVQLPNYRELNIETTKYDWALFRESQLKALSIPNTGMAVTIDIGDPSDIHPGNKKDVGIRLALAARKVAYGDDNVVNSGPIYSSMAIKGNRITLSFTNTGSGLVARNGKELGGFEICDLNSDYVPANAVIENNRITVWSDKIARPVAVRYAWANNPESANLYNKEGLPASPFRTSDLY